MKQQAMKFQRHVQFNLPNHTCSGSVFCDQTMHFRILVPALKYIVLISSIVPRNLSFEFRYILYIQMMYNARL